MLPAHKQLMAVVSAMYCVPTMHLSFLWPWMLSASTLVVCQETAAFHTSKHFKFDEQQMLLQEWFKIRELRQSETTSCVSPSA